MGENTAIGGGDGELEGEVKKRNVVEHMAEVLEKREASIKARRVSMAPFYTHNVDDLL